MNLKFLRPDGQVDNGEEQFNDDSEPLNQTECDAISVFTWGPGPMIPEPPSTNVLTDQYGLKYWQVTFNSDECTLTAQDPDSYTCTSPTVEANLVNPNGASSEEVSITINSTCVE